jgi:hypothetical protein
MNRMIAILASAMLPILVVTLDDSPARAESMNLFPAEGRKSLPRILTTASLQVDRYSASFAARQDPRYLSKAWLKSGTDTPGKREVSLVL